MNDGRLFANVNAGLENQPHNEQNTTTNVVALNQDCNLKSLCQFIYTLEQTCASKIGMTI